MTSKAYSTYYEPITAVLGAYGQATSGLLQHHIGGVQVDIDQCLAEMQAAGHVESCGSEQGQTLYRLKKALYWQERALIELALDHANAELLGLHRHGVLSFGQYTDIANLLVDAQEKLRAYTREPK